MFHTVISTEGFYNEDVHRQAANYASEQDLDDVKEMESNIQGQEIMMANDGEDGRKVDGIVQQDDNRGRL